MNQSVAKAISNANLPNGQHLDDEHIWKGPVIVLKAKYGGALPSDNVKYQVSLPIDRVQYKKSWAQSIKNLFPISEELFVVQNLGVIR